MDADRRWLAAQWAFVRPHLPTPPARIVEIGCGPLGGFVPAARAQGHLAEGVDPEAPDEPGFHRVGFEDYQSLEPADAVLACTSLHHVADLDRVFDRVRRMLKPGGVLMVVEWARDHFDEPTARWCFAQVRQPDAEADVHGGWLVRHRDRWIDSGLPWAEYLQSWAAEERLHTGGQIIAGLDARFDRRWCEFGPYFFADLAGTSEADEQAAIDNGYIRANGIRYVGQQR